MNKLLNLILLLIISGGINAVEFTGYNYRDDSQNLNMYPKSETRGSTWNLVERHELDQAITNLSNDRDNMINHLRNNIQNQILEQIKVTDDQIEALMTPKIKKIIKEKLKEEIKADLKREILAEIQGR